jgi:peptidyl-dipeptidase Dcp
MIRCLALAAAGGFALAACSTQPDSTPAAEAPAVPAETNPFYAESSLPYRMPPFDRIEVAHFLPAFEKGMADQLAEVEAVAADPEPATFENTIVPMERSGRLLVRVSNAFFGLNSADTNDAMETVQTEVAPKLADHADAIFLNSALFARVTDLYSRRDELGLDPESGRLLERYHTDFVRAGAGLSDEDKVRLRAINAELAALSTAFSQNLREETNASAVVVDTIDELDGLSESEIAAAASDARARGLEGKYVLSLQNTTGQPALAELTDRGVRERLYRASVQRGMRGNDADNREYIAKMVRLRAERARLLGYGTHASFVLEDETARTTRAVNSMLARLAPPAVANARLEAADMQQLIRAEGGEFQLQPWDWAYYAEKVRAAKYDLDEAKLKPYFEMNNVLKNGVFHAAGKLYGLRFEERRDLPVYHPDVRVFEVFEADGSAVGLFLADYYARPSKRGGAWMNEYVSQSGLFGEKPVVANHLNVPKPPEGQPTLLTFDEVETMFHEFGHALHGLFSDVRYPRFAGTTVPRDFVEYPSQVNEMWAVWPEVLANYARHYRTGEPIPRALIEKVLATTQFNQGFDTTEYLAAALLDQAWHQLGRDEVPADVMEFEADALEAAGVDFAPVPPRYRSPYFAHVFAGGYSAGYYAYIWSEVLDADSVEWFKENGGLTRENGDHFRRTLLSRGGSEDAMALFTEFAGRTPRIQPLLERRGLTASANDQGSASRASD